MAQRNVEDYTAAEVGIPNASALKNLVEPNHVALDELEKEPDWPRPRAATGAILAGNYPRLSSIHKDGGSIYGYRTATAAELSELGAPLVSRVIQSDVSDSIQAVKIDDMLSVVVESGRYVVQREGVVVGTLLISPTEYNGGPGTLRVQTLKIIRGNVINTYDAVFCPER